MMLSYSFACLHAAPPAVQPALAAKTPMVKQRMVDANGNGLWGSTSMPGVYAQHTQILCSYRQCSGLVAGLRHGGVGLLRAGHANWMLTGLRAPGGPVYHRQTVHCSPDIRQQGPRRGRHPMCGVRECHLRAVVVGMTPRQSVRLRLQRQHRCVAWIEPTAYDWSAIWPPRLRRDAEGRPSDQPSIPQGWPVQAAIRGERPCWR
jgi:hypothetical protein